MNEETKDAPRQGTSPWLRLLRLPNLLTVPGDPVAGYLLARAAAGGGSTDAVLLAGGASLCLYCFGLILNDLVDIHVDREERPDRPLPSGQIAFHKARGVAVAFAVTGLNLALFAGLPVLYAAAGLATLIILYNAGFKNLPVVGVVTMGLCRGLSFLLGVFAALENPRALLTSSGAPAIVGLLAVTLSVIAISSVARREMDPQKPMGMRRFLPFTALLMTLPALVVVLSALQRLAQPGATVYVFLMVMTLMRAWFLGGVLYRLQPVPVTVGGHIRNHLMVQASLCAGSGAWGLIPALTLVLLFQLFGMLSRRFYSS